MHCRSAIDEMTNQPTESSYEVGEPSKHTDAQDPLMPQETTIEAEAFAEVSAGEQATSLDAGNKS
jgi:hypothetical protein